MMFPDPLFSLILTYNNDSIKRTQRKHHQAICDTIKLTKHILEDAWRDSDLQYTFGMTCYILKKQIFKDLHSDEYTLLEEFQIMELMIDSQEDSDAWEEQYYSDTCIRSTQREHYNNIVKQIKNSQLWALYNSQYFGTLPQRWKVKIPTDFT